MQMLTILGATGSIGLSTLDVVRHNREQFSVFALSGHRQIDLLAQLCLEFLPKYAVVVEEQHAKKLKTILSEQNCKTEVLYGEFALANICQDSEVNSVVAAIVGAAGLAPCIAAAKAGKRILLANKEALVMSGRLFLDEVKRNGAELLPVDSEHNAIFQSLPLSYQNAYLDNNISDFGVKSIILTGSGGPFRQVPLGELSDKTPAQACAHPNWSMGQKISVDSATMMNKGLEFIEACYLFSVEPEFIEVVIHPQSIIHSMVRYKDGSVIAQLGQPDMKTPIAHCLAFPERINANVESYDFTSGASLSFDSACSKRYPNLYLAKQAFKIGQEATTVLNAANEVHVDLFLQGKISFTDIAKYNELALELASFERADSIEAIVNIDQETRVKALAVLKKGLEI